MCGFSTASRRSTNALTNRWDLLATHTEIITELSSHEHAAVKAHKRNPFRCRAGPSERFQLAISSPQVLDHLLISVPRTVQKTMGFLQ